MNNTSHYTNRRKRQQLQEGEYKVGNCNSRTSNPTDGKQESLLHNFNISYNILKWFAVSIQFWKRKTSVKMQRSNLKEMADYVNTEVTSHHHFTVKYFNCFHKYMWLFRYYLV